MPTPDHDKPLAPPHGDPLAAAFTALPSPHAPTHLTQQLLSAAPIAPSLATATFAPAAASKPLSGGPVLWWSASAVITAAAVAFAAWLIPAIQRELAPSDPRSPLIPQPQFVQAPEPAFSPTRQLLQETDPCNMLPPQ